MILTNDAPHSRNLKIAAVIQIHKDHTRFFTYGESALPTSSYLQHEHLNVPIIRSSEELYYSIEQALKGRDVAFVRFHIFGFPYRPMPMPDIFTGNRDNLLSGGFENILELPSVDQFLSEFKKQYDF